MRRLGVRVPTKDVEAYLHLWNVIGHLLGVCDELLVSDVADAAALVDTIRRRQFKASAEGQDMTGALLNLLDQLTPFHRFDDTIPPLIRHLIGDRTADLLLVPKSDLVDDLGRLERVAKWFLRSRLRPNRARLAALSTGVAHGSPVRARLAARVFRFERGGERHLSTCPITSPAAGSCPRDLGAFSVSNVIRWPRMIETEVSLK